MQSTSLHVAIIMDGNGRWATGRGLPRPAGHREGAEALRRVVRAAPACGIEVLTLYAFSADNWARPSQEVQGLLALFLRYFREEVPACREAGIRLTAIGRRDRLPLALRAAMATAERSTAAGSRLWLRLAIDYSGRDELLRAASRIAGERRLSARREGFTRRRLTEALGGAPDIDLLIRTGGERRLSDFLLWESAYAELLFREEAWPDFTVDHLVAAVREYHGRERRFGRIAEGKGA